MKSLVINSGSSSIKFQVFEEEMSVISGICEEIGNNNSKIKIKIKEEKEEKNLPLSDHKRALEEIIQILKSRNLFENFSCVIHRTVHGGEKFKQTTIVDEGVLLELKRLIPLAPLHNPANIQGIEIMKELMPSIPQIAVFDTSFHSTIPEEAYIYGVPYEWYSKYQVRRYGFHGTSHEYVINETKKLLNKENAKIICCHLGNGASICASIDGKSIDTSMGMTPLEGNIMGTRSGTIDPGIIEYMENIAHLSCKEITKILNKESGIKGISGITSDMRILEENMNINPNAKRAMNIYLQRLTQLIGSSIAVLGGVDAIVFTGGVGEHSPIVRKHIAEKLEFLGVEINKDSNEKNLTEITSPDSKVKFYVIPTNEELQMVRNAKKILN